MFLSAASAEVARRGSGAEAFGQVLGGGLWVGVGFFRGVCFGPMAVPIRHTLSANRSKHSSEFDVAPFVRVALNSGRTVVPLDDIVSSSNQARRLSLLVLCVPLKI